MVPGARPGYPVIRGQAATGLEVGPVVGDVIERLRRGGVPTPEVDARWLREAFPDPEALEEAVRRRVSREPLQLIIGTAAFRYLEVAVAPGVFIPRPETEVLAGLAIDRTPPGGIVVEPCTGTGAIAASIAHEAEPSRVVATDTNPAAVELASRNTARWPTVEVHHANLLAGLDPDLRGMVDVLVSNPPYLAPRQMEEAEPEVRDHDPVEALVGGPTGWEVVHDIVMAAPHWLAPGGWVLLEDDPARVEETVAALQRHLGPATVERDLTGRPRFALAQLGG